MLNLCFHIQLIFLSIFPDLTWFIKWVFGHTPVLLLVRPPLILKHFFLSSDAKFISRAHWQKYWKVPTLGALPTEPQWVPPWSDDSPLMTPFWCCQTASPQVPLFMLYWYCIVLILNQDFSPVPSGAHMFELCFGIGLFLPTPNSPFCLYCLKGLAGFAQNQYSPVLSHSDDIHIDEAGSYLDARPFVMGKLWHWCLQ